MNQYLMFAMLLIAVACGWLLGVWQVRARRNEKPLPRKSYELPYYFSADIPDYALDAFIDAVDVNSDTLETHLTLGAIHRRRGELERAIRIHENLLRRDGLTSSQVSLAKYELALDYMKAGLLDRAEESLQVLVENSESYRVAALFTLIDLYQNEREWLKAAYASNALHGSLNTQEAERLNLRRSHFHAELADQALAAKDYLSARRAIQQAERYGAKSRRPKLLMAALEMQLSHPERAKAILEQLLPESDELIEETARMFASVCRAMGDDTGGVAQLEQIYSKSRSNELFIIIARELQVQGRSDRLLEIIHETPPLDLGNLPLRLLSELDAGLYAKFSAQWANSGDAGAEHYQCHHCGFAAREYHWQCPSCRRWETLKTRSGLHA